MSSGLYPNAEQVERFLASVTASTIGQKYLVAQDADVIGMLLLLGTAPGAGDGVSVNVNCSPTSQITNVPTGAANQSVGTYNLWTAANVPTILGTATQSPATITPPTVVENQPYPLNYPFPGASGASGYKTAQATTQSTQTPVTSPPLIYIYQLGALTPPDNTYLDLNNITQNASLVHAGDVLSFVITGAGTGSAVGAAANLELVLLTQKH